MKEYEGLIEEVNEENENKGVLLINILVLRI